MKKGKIILFVLAVSQQLYGCSNSSDDDDGRGPFEDPPQVDFPTVRTSFPASMDLIEENRHDPRKYEHQVLERRGIVADEGASGTVNSGYKFVCETSYMATSAPDDEQAYRSLIDGTRETIFAFETDVSEISFLSINAVETDGRTGQEFLYIFPEQSSSISGIGRAFYLNQDVDRVRRSGILYFECFGFSREFSEDISIFRVFLDSVQFGVATGTTSTPAFSDSSRE